MRKIGTIFLRDLKSMFQSVPTIVIIVGLIILPSLYAWFNIKANWDPYGATAGIKVGIVNEDEGEIILGKEINIGNEVVQELQSNNKLGWQFVDRQEAEYHTKSGKYYAYIVIPKTFSKDLKTITEAQQIRPELIYVINEKSNAIAPKITSSGANTLKATISENIISTVNEVIFDIFNQLGVSIEQNLPKIRQASGVMITLDENANVIEENLENYRQGMITADELLEKVKEQLPRVDEILEKVNTIATESSDLITSSDTLLNEIASEIEISLQSISSSCEEVYTWANDAKNKLEQGKAIQESLTSLINQLDLVSKQIQALEQLIGKLEGLIESNALNSKLEALNTKVVEIRKEVANTLEIVRSGKEVSISLLQELEERVSGIRDLSQQSLTDFQTVTRPQIKNILAETVEVAGQISTLSQEIKSQIPQVGEVVDTARDGVGEGEVLITTIQDKFPSLKKDIHELASKLSFFMEDNSLDSLLSLLEKNPELVANYIAAPINLKEEALYPIPNYGSGMTPFYTVLAIWVGVVILSALLSTETPIKDVNEREEYIGKGLTFLTLSLIQSLIIALGDIYILKVYLVSPFIFVLLCLVNALVFTTIIYTLVALFGNLGKGIVIVLLVLQISSSGGTFPVEVIPPFFQKLSPFLPFTYAIGTLREAQGGIFYPNLYRYLVYLLMFTVIFIAIGVFFKKPLVKLTKAFNEQFKQSGLGE